MEASDYTQLKELLYKAIDDTDDEYCKETLQMALYSLPTFVSVNEVLI